MEPGGGGSSVRQRLAASKCRRAPASSPAQAVMCSTPLPFSRAHADISFLASSVSGEEDML
eukprot:3412610-Rhodomonas_salina.1